MSVAGSSFLSGSDFEAFKALFNDKSVAYQDHGKKAPDAVWARKADPAQGFDPVKFKNNQVRFFRSPSELGGLANIVAPLWPKGAVGLSLYWNNGLQSGGGTFVTTTTQNPSSAWSSGGRTAWMSFGGTMYENGHQQTGKTLTDYLTGVLRKSGDMVVKNGAIEATAERTTSMGGSKSFVFKHPETVEKTALKNYAAVQTFWGINNTGGDEGFRAPQHKICVESAPANFCNSPKTNGFPPTPNTIKGVIAGLERIIPEFHNGAGKRALFVQGVGQIGSEVAAHFLKQGHPVAASDTAINEAVLKMAHENYKPDRYKKTNPLTFILDISRRSNGSFSPTPTEAELGIRSLQDLKNVARTNNWKVVNGLKQALQAYPKGFHFVPCGPIGILTPEVRAYLRTSNYRTILGCANSIHGVDKKGSVMTSVWDMHRERIVAFHDASRNQGGAGAVAAGMMGLAGHRMSEYHQKIGESAVAELKLAKKVPPHIHATNEAYQRSNANIDAGKTVGARYQMLPAVSPYESNYRALSLGHYHGAATLGMAAWEVVAAGFRTRIQGTGFGENLVHAVAGLASFMSLDLAFKALISRIGPIAPMSLVAPFLSAATLSVFWDASSRRWDIDAEIGFDIVNRAAWHGLMAGWGFSVLNQYGAFIARRALAFLGVMGGLNVGIASFVGVGLGQMVTSFLLRPDITDKLASLFPRIKLL